MMCTNFKWKQRKIICNPLKLLTTVAQTSWKEEEEEEGDKERERERRRSG